MPKPDWPTAAPYVPATTDLDALRRAADGCRGCTRARRRRSSARARATPAWSSWASSPATRRTGRARRSSDRPAGAKRRRHATPDTWGVAACRPWLEAELTAVHPEVVVLLGATAGKALLGPSFRVTKSRGVLMAMADAQVLATLHPSAVPRSDDREAARAGLVADLRVAAQALA